MSDLPPESASPDLRTLLAASDLSLPAILLIAVLAFLLALRGTPHAAAAARRFGIVDRPDGRLKTHREPVPYLGGLAVFLAVLVSLLMVFELESPLLALLLSASLVLVLGLIDDLGALTPGVKFAGQFLAVWVLLKADVMIHLGYLPFWANAVLTALWLVGVMNAVNIIDIMDGLATSVAAVAASFLVVIALINELSLIAAAAAAVVGACTGFLVYNRSPARIYLGDAGSLFLGLMLGGLCLILRYDQSNALAVLNPVLLLSVPLFDTVFVSAVRLYRRQSPFRGSPDHFALRLRRAGWSVNRVVLSAAGATALAGILALINLGLSWEESLSLLVVSGALYLGLALALVRVRMDQG